MVSHDFSRGTITGLSGAARASLRQGASLQELGVHRSIVDVWRSVATPVGVEMPAMSTGDIARHLGRGVSSDARPANAALFGGEVEFGLEGESSGDARRRSQRRRGSDGHPEGETTMHGETANAASSGGEGNCLGVPAAADVPAGDCTQPCVSAMSYDAASCDVWLTLEDGLCDSAPRSASSSDLLAFEARGGVSATFTTATTAEIELFFTGLGLIAANLDLLVWSGCMVAGVFGEVAGLAMSGLSAGVLSLNIVVVENVGRAGASYLAFSPFVPLVFIQRDNPQIQQWLSMWKSSDVDTRLCAALQASVLLVHEMTHSVRFDLGEVGIFACDNSRMMANTYEWAVANRYPGALRSACCGKLADSSVIGCGSQQYVSNLQPEDACQGSVPGESWLEEVGGFLEGIADVLFPHTAMGAGGGPDPEWCLICPSACAAGAWSKLEHDPDECFAAMLKWNEEKIALRDLERLEAP